MDISKLANPNDIITEVVNYTSFPLNKIDMLVGRKLYEDLRYLDSPKGTPLILKDTELNEKFIRIIRSYLEKNSSNLPTSIKIISTINNPKQQAMKLDDKIKFENSFRSALNNLRYSIKDGETEVLNILNCAKTFVGKMNFLNSGCGISYNYLDYGMINPASYDRTINANTFIVSLGKAYNKNRGDGEPEVDLILLSQIALLSTVGDMLAPEQMSNNPKNGEIESTVALKRFYKTIFENQSFLKLCPNISFKVLEKFNKDYVSLYSYLIMKDDSRYRAVSSFMLQVILRTNENIDGSGPLGIKLDMRNLIDKMAAIIKLGFLWQDRLIELNKNSGSANPEPNQVCSVTDFYQSFKHLSENKIIDSRLYEIMKEINPVYQVRDMVKLSNGKIAVVKELNKDNPEQPVIVLKGDDGERVEINLFNENFTDITIVGGYASYEIEYNLSASSKTISDENPETTVKLR